jgi:hypothetical protein
MVPCILNLNAAWRLMISFTPWLLYHQYVVDRKVAGWSVVGLDSVKGKNNLPQPGIKPSFLGHPTYTLVIIATEHFHILVRIIKYLISYNLIFCLYFSAREL